MAAFWWETVIVILLWHNDSRARPLLQQLQQSFSSSSSPCCSISAATPLSALPSSPFSLLQQICYNLVDAPFFPASPSRVTCCNIIPCGLIYQSLASTHYSFHKSSKDFSKACPIITIGKFIFAIISLAHNPWLQREYYNYFVLQQLKFQIARLHDALFDFVPIYIYILWLISLLQPVPLLLGSRKEDLYRNMRKFVAKEASDDGRI